ncbi:bifunctional DNA-formamidopyrimidine glycosylase/DNA-(apurinic or apyrimidinic site) lyase [Aestuariibacter salexigens]|uniref:bifunctional DNA-formamidopyrimidine glycosylase/DNA-(apurinic or apyrimidinic site) lyase n=1 Tax=Aestuariibacter salexigens TaxID=226010 RepID=UPI00047CCE5D|nr:bifunctional DNA-formamidopyrimidine glycosylase/DNA-(apurinic or apyrimidinic site) lyase [Aestuariibacter salexigens]
MPELPEVEVSRLGILPHLIHRRIERIIIRQPMLRWPVPDDVLSAQQQTITDIRRRAKYLLIDTAAGSIILHLGMSGKLRVVDAAHPLQKHDHLDIVLDSGQCLRFNDPRRFGACLWQPPQSEPIELLQRLGPEPLTDGFDGEHLYTLSRGKSVAVKNFIMDNHVVVGVGNIYANESLFLAGIDPRRAAGRVSRRRYIELGGHIKQVLAKAIEQGGTTLKDFTKADGNPGYFAQHLRVYGRDGKPCERCGNSLRSAMIGQRNTFYCTNCQR